MVDFILNVCCKHVRVPVCSWSCLKSMLLPIYEAALKAKSQDTSNKRTMQRIRLRRQFFTSCIETYLCEKDIDEQWLENRWAITSSMSCRSVCVGCCLHMDAYTVMRKVDCAWNVWEEIGKHCLQNVWSRLQFVSCLLFMHVLSKKKSDHQQEYACHRYRKAGAKWCWLPSTVHSCYLSARCCWRKSDELTAVLFVIITP